MKKFFAAVVCCALMIANISAQEGTSVVEATAKVALASAQEPVAPEAQSSAADAAAPVAVAPATVQPADAAAIQVQSVPMDVQAAPVYGNSGCGCGSSVVSYAAPMAAPMVAAPMASNCCQPAPSCCPANDCCQNRGFHFSRPYIIRNLGGRMTSIGGRNNCCCN